MSETIDPQTLKELLERNSEAPRLIDVREPWEFEICRIPGSENIPMGELAAHLPELDRQQMTVVICHHGTRSLQVADYLSSAGFPSVMNLAGGVDAWARTIDPDMQQY